MTESDLQLKHIKEYARKILQSRPGKIFTKQGVGMGCAYYIRRSDPLSDLEVLYMHSDDWGQYRDKCTFDEFIYFISEYEYVDERYPIDGQQGNCAIC
jgi:hypothetical protein